MELREIADVADDYTGRARTVLAYSLLMKSLVDLAKEPGFSKESWAPLAELVATDGFVRVGNFKEVMNWSEYVEFLTGWAGSSQWAGSFRRITETPDVVFLELEERSSVGDFSSVVNSVSIYEFDDAGKISHIDVYLQMALSESAMLGSYEDVQISE
ncbi:MULTISPECIES: hypothetical protein [unclassified Rhodococcus (in: high G+C Gram-positive bacteria)]|uniref:hypothetical protein n=1 Tax=Rhodococcus sp. SJ-3 TaxID=3454628 RepID=UPI003F7A62D3